MNHSEIQKSTEERMKRSITALSNGLAKIRTGRAHAGLLDHVTVEYYGSEVPVSQVANITVVDARTLSVQVWEKHMAEVVDRAIRESDLGLNPVLAGETLRIPLPPLTEERRQDLTRIVRAEGEEAKVAIRNLRREANDQSKRLLRDKAISEDDDRRFQDEIQRLTDKYVAEVDALVANKEEEVMTI
ncbi:MAG TPA: ribosome recycling factor [Paenalcaligenes sp.]|nr:ribosome recycling factor [Paenalcaligenes sp.]